MRRRRIVRHLNLNAIANSGRQSTRWARRASSRYRAFKDALRVDPGIRYFDHIHARKAAMLEALAREAV
jgi:hypothetical protein